METWFHDVWWWWWWWWLLRSWQQRLSNLFEFFLYPHLLLLLTTDVLAFSVEKLRWNTSRIALRTAQKLPKLFHENGSLVVEKSREIDLHVTWIDVLLFEHRACIIDEHVIFRSEELHNPLGNPGSQDLESDFGQIDFDCEVGRKLDL